MPTYAIRGGVEGARRLDLLAQVMAPTTGALLRAAGVARGMACVDLGCGAGHVSRYLAELVGPSGSVLGLDFDEVKLDTARRAGAAAGLDNVDFRVADLTAWSATTSFNLAYGRFIVSHLADRPGFVARAAGALRPEGLLILEDIDYRGAFCHPANEAFERASRLYLDVIRRRGGDATAGAQLYQFCLDAGLEDVQVRVVQPAHGGRVPEKGLTLSTLINIGEAAVDEGIATADEVAAIADGLAAFTDDHRSVIACPRIVQVWGRA